MGAKWVENTWKMGGIFQLCKMHTYFDHWSILLAHASHKDIWNSVTFHALLMNNTPTFFKHNFVNTCIQYSTKVIMCRCTPSYCICQNSYNSFRSCLHCTCVPLSWGSHRYHIWNFLEFIVKHIPSRPHCIHGNQAIPTRASNVLDHFQWSTHEHTCLLQTQEPWHMHSITSQK